MREAKPHKISLRISDSTLKKVEELAEILTDDIGITFDKSKVYEFAIRRLHKALCPPSKK